MGKSPREVGRLLGEPFRIDTEHLARAFERKDIPPVISHWYLSPPARDTVEVAFPAGKAEWITVYRLIGVPFNAEAIRALGLPGVVPSHSVPNFSYKWDNVAGLKEVDLFNDAAGGGIHYAFIVVSRDPNK